MTPPLTDTDLPLASDSPASPRPKKVFIKTFGCQMNEYDSDKMLDVLADSEGMIKTDRPEDADVILFNTCSVREKAQEKVFHDLGRVRPLKALNPNLVIGVGGCVASQEGGEIVKRAPYVDVVFGPQTLHRLPTLIAERHKTGKAAVDISFPEIEKFDAFARTNVKDALRPLNDRALNAITQSADGQGAEHHIVKHIYRSRSA